MTVLDPQAETPEITLPETSGREAKAEPAGYLVELSHNRAIFTFNPGEYPGHAITPLYASPVTVTEGDIAGLVEDIETYLAKVAPGNISEKAARALYRHRIVDNLKALSRLNVGAHPWSDARVDQAVDEGWTDCTDEVHVVLAALFDDHRLSAGARHIAYLQDNPEFGTRLSFNPLTEDDRRRGWTETPLFAGPDPVEVYAIDVRTAHD